MRFEACLHHRLYWLRRNSHRGNSFREALYRWQILFASFTTAGPELDLDETGRERYPVISGASHMIYLLADNGL